MPAKIYSTSAKWARCALYARDYHFVCERIRTKVTIARAARSLPRGGDLDPLPANSLGNQTRNDDPRGQWKPQNWFSESQAREPCSAGLAPPAEMPLDFHAVDDH
ncbi:hypothetical protein Cob_v000988 [Colletotrichum orbiculare MAFF 240422]|uniref:Uncharacterized protein n=1 Tax=Colletotrichum orbiculare (strain 104-T / ATCC 96160 / CBS 514.97 / LARS 414 / MAFF 240422) TaxID=1213857 RepID=A0A484G9H6_COLOR|nr:hypothetical protein Cob_v000988 [Colletotrichum orbiculare MAFF 240422]